MPKRRRLLTPMKKRPSTVKVNFNYINEDKSETPTTPRGRLKGALKEALDPTTDDHDASQEFRKERQTRRRYKSESSPAQSSDEEMSAEQRLARLPYVLKLFDRSVDLSQFKDDSPLYPICRAWILNQPKICYKKYGKKKYRPPEPNEDSVELPGPEGPAISRIPQPLPRPESRKDLQSYWHAMSPPARSTLLAAHCGRWAAVRRAWQRHAARVEARYAGTQQLLNKINVINSGA